MLKLYHKTIAAYDKWQVTWAKSKGLDPARIRRDQGEYNAVMGQNQKDRYLATHPELREFYAVRNREWDRTPMGLAYGLFFDSRTVLNYLAAHHETPAQVEQQAEAVAG